jgi:hypothetical protein
MSTDPKNLSDVLDLIEDAAEGEERVAFEDMLDTIGQRSFGPLLLLCGLVILAPIVGDIPGVPTAVGLVVLLIAIQLLVGRKHFWFPAWLRERSVGADSLRKAVSKVRRPARFVDRFLRPRLPLFVRGAAIYAITALSAAIAVAIPAMEIVPFTANAAGAVLAAFGLALIGRDGLLALIALVLAVSTAAIVIFSFASG